MLQSAWCLWVKRIFKTTNLQEQVNAAKLSNIFVILLPCFFSIIKNGIGLTGVSALWIVGKVKGQGNKFVWIKILEWNFSTRIAYQKIGCQKNILSALSSLHAQVMFN